MSNVIGGFVNAQSRTIGPAAVGFQAGLMAAISLVTVLTFNILRPRNKIIYEPKVKYHVDTKAPPKISGSFFGWLSPLLHTKEAELFDKVGLDAVTYLRFLRLCRWMFSAIAAMTCGILIPINIIYNLRKVDEANRDVLSMLTLRDVSGNVLFVHVAVSYLITFTVMGFVYVHWKRMVELRLRWFRSPEYTESFYSRTLMIQKVPKKYQSDEGLQEIFNSTSVPYPTQSVLIGRHVGILPELIAAHNQCVRELEQTLVTYLRGGKLGKKRPTITKGGFLGIGGQKVDAINLYTQRVIIAQQKIDAQRKSISTRKPENHGFASMAAVPYAHVVANLLRNKSPRGTIIQLAPNPKDIIWDNLGKSAAVLANKRFWGWIFLAVVCTFNTIPLLIVSFLANLIALTAYVPFLETWANESPKSFSLVSGVLPSAVAAIFGYFLPRTMRWLSQFQGAITRSRLDRAVVARYFAFLMISQLLIFTLIGVLINCVKEIVLQIGQHKSFGDIIKNFDKLPGTINRTYLDQANYWLTFFPLRGFLAIFDLAQILNLVWIWIKTRLFGRTPRDIREWTRPADFEYAIYYSNLLFMGAVGIVFAPLAPLVVAAAAVVFWLSSFVYKYQLMFVFVSKVESGGRMWNVVINRLLSTVICMQLLLSLTIGLQTGFRTWRWTSAIPPVFIILAFKVYIDRTFRKQYDFYLPSQEEVRNAKIYRNDGQEDTSERFGHPVLTAAPFVPSLHQRMVKLLPEVYGQEMVTDNKPQKGTGAARPDAQVIIGGLRFAIITQKQLENDTALYQRDRGQVEYDDVVAPQVLASDGSTLGPSKSEFFNTPNTSNAGLPYKQYLNTGTEIELARLDSQVDQQPLLSDQQRLSTVYPAGGASNVSLPAYQQQNYAQYPPQQQQQQQNYAQYPPQQQHNYAQYPPQQQQQQEYSPYTSQQQLNANYAQYPPQQQPNYAQYRGSQQLDALHPPAPSRTPSTYSQNSFNSANTNMAGRGAYNPNHGYQS